MAKNSFASSWHTAKFDDILTKVDRKFIIDDGQEYDCVGVRWYGKGAFIRERLLGADISRKQQWHLKVGDVVYNKLFAWKGAFAIADEVVDGCIVSDKFPTYRIEHELIEPNFLKYYFTTREIALQAESLSKGAAAISKLTLNPPQFWDLTIPLPPLDEQRRIVARIEALAARVNEAQRLRQQTVEEAGVFVDSTLSLIYDDLINRFGTHQIGTIADVKGGKRLPAGERLSDTKTPFVYIRVSDMKNHSVDMSDLKYVPVHIQPNIARYTISSKDVYVTIAGTIGYTGTIPHELDGANLTENAAKLVFHQPETINQRYVTYALRSPRVQDQFRLKKTEAAQPKLALHRIGSTQIPTPPLDEQRRIVAYLDSLQAQVDALRRLQTETQSELDALLPSILDKAFKGEL